MRLAMLSQAQKETFFHLAHNVVVGNGVVMSNVATLAGHVIVEDEADVVLLVCRTAASSWNSLMVLSSMESKGSDSASNSEKLKLCLAPPREGMAGGWITGPTEPATG